MKNQTINTIGFIGLGVMGNSMCKNLLQNKNWSIMVNDINRNKEEDLHNHGAIIAADIEDLFDKSDVIITCLPGGSFVYEMYFGKQNMISFIKQNQYIVDLDYLNWIIQGSGLIKNLEEVVYLMLVAIQYLPSYL